ncbi:MAG: MaoC family dehydratase N-terminal domain-containing protein [Chloroflexota bacterium]
MFNSAIGTGGDLGEVHFSLDPSHLREYISTVGDQSELFQSSEVAPLTAVAALGVGTFLGKLALPAGTVHVAQELAAHRAATWGQRLSCRARVAQSSQRREGRFLVVEFTIADHGGQPIMDGRTTLLVPGREK